MITVGYGDIIPTNHNEMLVAIAIMLFGCGVFGYALNQIGNIIQDFFRKEQEVDEKLYIINRYMDKLNLTQDLRFQIRQHLLYYWQQIDEREEEQEQKIISQLSSSLKEQLAQ